MSLVFTGKDAGTQVVFGVTDTRATCRISDVTEDNFMEEDP